MGCCVSHPFFAKETVYEVTLDADGVAQRVPKGQGTHFIHISPNKETHLEEKTSVANNDKWPSLTTPPTYNSSKRVAPTTAASEDQSEKPKADEPSP